VAVGTGRSAARSSLAQASTAVPVVGASQMALDAPRSIVQMAPLCTRLSNRYPKKAAASRG